MVLLLFLLGLKSQGGIKTGASLKPILRGLHDRIHVCSATQKTYNAHGQVLFIRDDEYG